MTDHTCTTCGQKLPEPRKAREWWLGTDNHGIRTAYSSVSRGTENNFVLCREVLPVPKEERKPKVWPMCDMWEGTPAKVELVELTPAVRAALSNAGIEI